MLTALSVNVLGIPLSVNTIAYIEQDKVIAACATSALWSAFQKAAHSNGYHIPTLYEITDNATVYSTRRRPIPSGGLNAEQMCRAIRAVGLEPEFWEILDADNNVVGLPLASTYAYLRAGMPVIALVTIGGSGHAIALNGYRLGERGQPYNELRLANLKLESAPIDIKLTGSRIEALYSHDDQIGPFCRANIGLLKIVKTNEGGYNFIPVDPEGIEQVSGAGAKGSNNEEEAMIVPYMHGPWDERTDTGSEDGIVPIIPFALIAPLYHKIRVPFLTILYHAGRMDRFLRRYNPGVQMEWDIHITSVNDCKKDIAQRDGIPLDIRKKLLGSLHPRFIWLARAIVHDELVCEMLADATDMELSFQVYSISLFNPYLRKNIEKNYRTMSRATNLTAPLSYRS